VVGSCGVHGRYERARLAIFGIFGIFVVVIVVVLPKLTCTDFDIEDWWWWNLLQGDTGGELGVLDGVHLSKQSPSGAGEQLPLFESSE
jgi:hypothetical protein